MSTSVTVQRPPRDAEQSITIQRPNNASVVVTREGVAGIRGEPGPPGPRGEAGDSVITDPGDLTLLFDNQLI